MHTEDLDNIPKYRLSTISVARGAEITVLGENMECANGMRYWAFTVTDGDDVLMTKFTSDAGQREAWKVANLLGDLAMRAVAFVADVKGGLK